jgi:hypothetical protein
LHRHRISGSATTAGMTVVVGTKGTSLTPTAAGRYVQATVGSHSTRKIIDVSKSRHTSNSWHSSNSESRDAFKVGKPARAEALAKVEAIHCKGCQYYKNLKQLTYWPESALCEGISNVSLNARAGRNVVHYAAYSINATNSRTRVNALVPLAGFVRGTI